MNRRSFLGKVVATGAMVPFINVERFVTQTQHIEFLADRFRRLVRLIPDDLVKCSIIFKTTDDEQFKIPVKNVASWADKISFTFEPLEITKACTVKDRVILLDDEDFFMHEVKTSHSVTMFPDDLLKLTYDLSFDPMVKFKNDGIIRVSGKDINPKTTTQKYRINEL